MASKVIIVTGASRGIGLAVAEYLLRASHKVVLVSRQEPVLKDLKTRYSSQVEYMTADLKSMEVAPQLTELAVKSFGRLDGVVINHGALLPMRRIADSNVQDWIHLYEINLFSALALSKASIPFLRKTKGRIIFTSSGAALNAYASWGAYGSSKAALNSLVQHIAVEEPDIVTVAVSPGRVNTAMQQELRENGEGNMDEKDLANFVSAYNEGKLNEPEGPGKVIARLALEARSEISGQYLKWDSPELVAYRE